MAEYQAELQAQDAGEKNLMESWQIFFIAHKKLPTGRLQKIYRRSARLVAYWAANPRDCDVTHRNPLDRIRMMLDELNMAGYGEYARAAIDYMAEPLGGEFAEKETSVSDKGSVDGEAADLSVAGGNLINEIRCALEDDLLDTAERIRIKEAARKVIKEVEQILDAAGMSK